LKRVRKNVPFFYFQAAEMKYCFGWFLTICFLAAISCRENDTKEPGEFRLVSLTVDGVDNGRLYSGVSVTPVLKIKFSQPVDSQSAKDAIKLSYPTGDITLNVSTINQDSTINVQPAEPLKYLTSYQFEVSSSLTSQSNQRLTDNTNIKLTTEYNSNDKFTRVSDNELLDLVQKKTFNYFYDFGHPTSGMARERNSSGDVVTTGGSGFGIMALIVGIERGFITRQQGIDRLTKIITFLETADRFHGAWSHWINGTTGKVIPFSTKDNGGDLVETSFLVQGLLAFRQYLKTSDAVELLLINRINALWQTVEWDWYRKNNEEVLYWHWSPNYNWDMNFPLYGYFEEQITYVLAAASPTHSIPKSVYTNGYGKNGAIKTGNTYYGYKLPLGTPSPLFWVHYSYLGLDPHFTDDFANYWEQNVNASLINHAYCVDNPKKYYAYSDSCWGLTASDNQNGYNAHSPGNDLGVISPTAALSSFPYTPTESMKALKFFYYTLGDKLLGTYGFYDAFNLSEGWIANSYLAIDQGPIVVMIENYRTGLLWNLFMSAPEVQVAKTKLGLH
jgi:hypothetical protein